MKSANTAVVTNGGSLLVELLIAMTIMSIALISAVGAFSNAQRANREVQDAALVLESMSFLLADITREAKYSTNYTCEKKLDLFCKNGDDNVVIQRLGVNRVDRDIVRYQLDSSGGFGRIVRSIIDDDGTTIIHEGDMTAGTVDISRFMVYTYTDRNSLEPDRLRIVIEGSVRGSDTAPVRLQTTIAARL